jgi:Cytochrome P460
LGFIVGLLDGADQKPAILRRSAQQSGQGAAILDLDTAQGSQVRGLHKLRLQFWRFNRVTRSHPLFPLDAVSCPHWISCGYEGIVIVASNVISAVLFSRHGSGKVEVSMKTAWLLLEVAVVVVVSGLMTLASGPADKDDAPIFLSELPEGYRDWKLIAVSRLTTSNGDGPAAKPDTPKSGSQLRAELGNDIAIKAYREGTLPFPDGAVVVALHWDQVASEKNNKVLARGFPGAGIQSFVPGTSLNMQVMVKDSKKYAATGGWGFGDFKNGKRSSEKVMKTCFACHSPAKDHDFVFTRYAP